MLIVLAVIVLIGLFAIYQSARAIEDLAERRSQFVSSVTHELKTPLTNIRMYIEMLEQGIAKSPEREQEYFRILDSEGVRLSRLINNVLEMSKLERQQRHLNLQTGSLAEVVGEVETVMAEKLKQDGFSLIVQIGDIPPFKYDREVMIQVLINGLSSMSGRRQPGKPASAAEAARIPSAERRLTWAAGTSPPSRVSSGRSLRSLTQVGPETICVWAPGDRSRLFSPIHRWQP